MTGGLNNSALVGGGATTTGVERACSSSAISTSSFLKQLAIPKPGYTSLSPDNIGLTPAVGPANSSLSRPSTPCVLQQPQVPTRSSSPIPSNMCGTTGPCLLGSPAQCHQSIRSSSPALPMKRKLSLIDYEEDYDPRPKRISPFHNTPKQRRDEKRKVLRMSIQKLRQIDDPELFLRRSVLINNMTKRMQKELREEKRYGYGYGYYPSTFSSYVDCPVEQDCFYSSPPAHRKRLNSCSYGEADCESNTNISSSSHLPSSPSSLTCSNTSNSYHDTDYVHRHKVSAMFDGDSCVEEPVEKLADDLSDSLMRTVCGDSDDPGHQEDSDESHYDQDMDSCASLSDSSSEESSPPASPPSDSEMTESCNDTNKGSTLTEMDRQILGEMDIVFNNLISVLSETWSELQWPEPRKYLIELFMYLLKWTDDQMPFNEYCSVTRFALFQRYCHWDYMETVSKCYHHGCKPNGQIDAINVMCMNLWSERGLYEPRGANSKIDINFDCEACGH